MTTQTTFNAGTPKKKLIHVYCDESRHTNQRYMVLGGVWIPADKEIEFSKRCHDFRSQERHLLSAYLKWVKATSKNFLKFYKQFVDVFFDFPDIRFNCIVVDTHALKIDLFHQGDRELAFYKFYFFLLKCNMSSSNRYLIHLDRLNNKKSGRLQVLKDKLNNYFSSRGLASHQVVSNIEARECKLYNQLQIADILIGAVGYKHEGYTTSPGKVALMNHIYVRRLAAQVKLQGNKLNIWLWRSKYSKGD